MGCPKIVPKGNLSEMVSNWQISIGYEDNQIMTGVRDEAGADNSGGALGALGVARRCAGALEKPAGRDEGAPMSRCGDGRHRRVDVMDGRRE